MFSATWRNTTWQWRELEWNRCYYKSDQHAAAAAAAAMPPRNPHHGASPRLSGGRVSETGKPWRVSSIPWARFGVKHAFVAFAAVFAVFATLQARRGASSP
jgi:hypothetical protein